MIEPLREGEIMGVYLDFDRYADPALTPAQYVLLFGAAVSDATMRANQQRLRGADKLAAFGAWCARQFLYSIGDIDGGSAQDAMKFTGVLVKRVATETCCDNCRCAEYGEFPQDCYMFPADVIEAMANHE